MASMLARVGTSSSVEEADSAPFSIKRDSISGIVHVAGSGFWTPMEVDQHFFELATLVRSVRQAGGQIRVIVDLRGTPAQSPETIERIGVGARIYGEGDRIAIIVDSSLAKMQMRRVVRSAQHEIFISPKAAMTWLSTTD